MWYPASIPGPASIVKRNRNTPSLNIQGRPQFRGGLCTRKNSKSIMSGLFWLKQLVGELTTLHNGDKVILSLDHFWHGRLYYIHVKLISEKTLITWLSYLQSTRDLL